jgi:putative transposase
MRDAVSSDHIHLLLSAPPTLAPAKLAQYIKGRSSRHSQAEFPGTGYLCATDEATIKA